jgi:putative ABC transport system ATP-binding protein
MNVVTDVATKAVVEARDISKHVMTAAGELSVLDAIDVQLAASESRWQSSANPAPARPPCCRLLAGLDEPSSGRIELFGEPLTGLDEDGRAALRLGRVGFVFQAFHLLPSFTALENVAAPLELAGSANAMEPRARGARPRRPQPAAGPPATAAVRRRAAARGPGAGVRDRAEAAVRR